MAKKCVLKGSIAVLFIVIGTLFLSRVTISYASFETMDVPIPELSNFTVTRVSDTEATLTFDSDTAGELYYAVLPYGSEEPSINTSDGGEPIIVGTQTLDLLYLTPDAKELYVLFKDGDNNFSEMMHIRIPDFDPETGISGGLFFNIFDPYSNYASGVYSINPVDGSMELLYPTSGIYPDIILSGGVLYSGSFYMIQSGSGSGTLFEVNPMTGALTSIGSVALETVVAMAYNPADGNVYVVDYNLGYQKLYILDMDTLTTTFVGTLPTYHVFIGMDFAGNGDLYLIDLQDDTLSIADYSNLLITTTVVGSLGLDINYAQDIAFDHNTGILYGVLYDNNNMGLIASIDTTTGIASTLHSIITEGDALIMGVDFHLVRYFEDGLLIQHEYVLDGTSATPRITPVKTGFTFTGWDTTYDDITGDTDVTAVFERNTYTLHYEMQNGSIIPNTYYLYEETLSLFINPIKVGYHFDGWYTDSAYNNAFLQTTMPAYDVTIYAKWEPNAYTVTYQMGDTTETETVLYGESLQDVPVPNIDGYTFTGWLLNNNSYDVTTYIQGLYETTFVAALVDSAGPVLGDVEDIHYLLSDWDTFTVPSITLTDNEDSNPIVHTYYYDNTGTHIVGDIDDFLEYVSESLSGYVGYVGEDALGNLSEVKLIPVSVTDDVPPVISGVSNNILYVEKTNLRIMFNEGTATLNGEPFTSGTIVYESGFYTLVVTDAANNTTSITFEIEESFNPWIIVLPLTILGAGVLIYLKRASILSLFSH